MNKAYDFYSYILSEKRNITKSPFLLKWFLDKHIEYGKVPIKPSRVGVPRGETHAIPRYKLRLSLCRAVFQQINMRKFAEACGASYLTVRQWDFADDNYERIDALSEEFTECWFNKFCELVETPDLEAPFDDYGLSETYGDFVNVIPSKEFKSLIPLDRFLYELRYYPNVLHGRIMIKMHIVMDEKVSSPDYWEALFFFRLNAFASKIRGLKLNDLRTFTEVYYKGEIQYYKGYFDALVTLIEDGDTERAKKLVDYLKFQLTDNLLPHYNELAVEDVVNKFKNKKRKERRKPKNEKRNSVKEKSGSA